MLKKCSLHIVMLALALAFSHSRADAQVCFFDTWNQVYYNRPVGTSDISSVIWETAYEIYFEKKGYPENKDADKHIVATLDSTAWRINSKYLKKEFSGDGALLRGYVPLFFNDRVAYATYLPFDDSNARLEYYYIDFQKREVSKVTHKSLPKLLADYPDLKMRYEGLKDQKNLDVILDFFLDYVERACDDPMRPLIMDLEKR